MLEPPISRTSPTDPSTTTVVGYSGSLPARAKAAGKSLEEFVAGNINATGPVGKMARMAYYAQGNHGDGKSSMGSPGDQRPKGNRLYQVG